MVEIKQEAIIWMKGRDSWGNGDFCFLLKGDEKVMGE